MISLLERRNLSDLDDRWYVPLRHPTSSDIDVGPETALRFSAVWAAISVLTSAIASVPLKLKKKTGRATEDARDHPLYKKMHRRPNAWQTSFEWREMGQGHILTRGNSYNQKVMTRRGRLDQLVPLHPDRMKVKVEGGRIIYEFTRREGGKTTFREDEILHLRGLSSNGLTGYSPISLGRESIGLGMAAERHGAAFFGNYAQPPGILHTDANPGQEVREAIRDSWYESQSGDNRHKIAVLSHGLRWQEIGLSNEDAQFIETRRFSVTEIARWFNLPPHKIRDMSDATFSNIEHQNLEFVVDSIRPWCVRWEQRLDLSLLTEREIAEGYFFRFNLEALLRGDSSARAAFYQQLFHLGALSPNEIRDKEDMNPVEGGDQRFVQLSLVPLDQASEPMRLPGGADSAASAPEDEEEEDEDGEGEAEGEERALPSRAVVRAHLQRRSITLRRRYMNQYERLFREAADRVVGREVNRIGRMITAELSDSGDEDRDARNLRIRIEEYYTKEAPGFVRSTFLPLLVAYMELVGEAAAEEIAGELDEGETERFARDYAEVLATRYVESSRRQLRKIIRESPREELEDELRGRLDEWQSGRPEKIGLRESVQAGGAAAKMVYAAAGARSIWVTLGESCPLCQEMEGRVVAGSGNFAEEGEEIDPGDGETNPLRVSKGIGHPQLHGGCDCMVAAA